MSIFDTKITKLFLGALHCAEKQYINAGDTGLFVASCKVKKNPIG